MQQKNKGQKQEMRSEFLQLDSSLHMKSCKLCNHNDKFPNLNQDSSVSSSIAHLKKSSFNLNLNSSMTATLYQKKHRDRKKNRIPKNNINDHIKIL